MHFDIYITASLLRKVFLRRLFRNWPMLLLLFVLIGLSVLFSVSAGSFSSVGVITLAIGVGLIFLFISAYFQNERVIREWTRAQGTSPVRYTLTDDAVQAASNLGKSELKWNVFRELVEYPDYLLLRYSSGASAHLTIPTANVPAEALEFIRRKFSALGIPLRRM